MYWLSAEVLEISLCARCIDCMCMGVVSNPQAAFVSDVCTTTPLGYFLQYTSLQLTWSKFLFSFFLHVILINVFHLLLLQKALVCCYQGVTFSINVKLFWNFFIIFSAKIRTKFDHSTIYGWISTKTIWKRVYIY